MFNYLFITNKPEIASYAESCGVTRIFLDLEVLGKLERQGHLDTVISQHSIDDIKPIKEVLRSAELMVRVNPLNQESQSEIDKVINSGADIIMLPMFQSFKEVKVVGEMIRGRAKFIPLIETYGAALDVDKIQELDCVDELHIGLNDLHLDMGLEFMFQLLSDGFVEEVTSKISKPFGIGGVARIGSGLIPAEYIMAEHIRLKSSAVILSRAFHMRSLTLDELTSKIDLREEIKKLNETLQSLQKKNELEIKNIHDEFKVLVNNNLGEKK